MNEIFYDRAKEEIGQVAFGDLDGLLSFLGDTMGNQPRFAQSIITRSEVELFGLSIPRFAIRMYLRKGGFVNCRRMALLAKVFHRDNNTEWGDRYPDSEIQPFERNRAISDKPLPHIAIGVVLEDQCCIADSLIPPPARLRRFKFRYVDTSRCKLMESYGEDPKGDFGCILPYTKNMNLGGGLCAQAVSFMVTAILANYSRSIQGLAEITALANDNSCRELSLGSLSPEGMARYFDRNNLRLSEQCLTKVPTPKAPWSKINKFASAIICYVQSGMPVILPSNMRRLTCFPTHTQSIYTKNGLLIDRKHIKDLVNHVILVTGYCSGKDILFTFNDPATRPYLVATAKELFQVGALRDGEDKIADNGMILQVVPSPVRMPLLEERIRPHSTQEEEQPANRRFGYGLETISRVFHYLCNFPCPAKPNLAPYRFQLVCSDTPNLDWKQTKEPQRTQLERGLLRAVSQLEKSETWQRHHWLWLELFPDQSLWIWDAEATPLEEFPRTKDGFLAKVLSEYLLGIVHIDPVDNSVVVSL